MYKDSDTVFMNKMVGRVQEKYAAGSHSADARKVLVEVMTCTEGKLELELAAKVHETIREKKRAKNCCCNE